MKNADAAQFRRIPSVSLLSACALAVGPAIGLGIGRFAYSLLLPAMRSDLQWTYSQAGSLNTWNAFGYLLGALCATVMLEKFGERRVFALSCVSCCLLLGSTAGTANLAFLNLLRFLLGLSAALSFVGGGTMVSALAREAGAKGELFFGLFYAGTGAGILLSGITTPILLSATGSWSAAWLGLAAASSVLFITAILVGIPNQEMHGAGNASANAPHRKMMFLLACNILYGAGYIGYMTFMIAFIRDGGHHAVVQAMFWSLMGLAAVAAPWLWTGVIGRARGGSTIALLIAVTIAGAALPLVSTSLPWLFTSALIFGCTFFAVITAFVSFVRKNVPQTALRSGIGAGTAAVGLGQIAGPLIVGTITDHFSDLRSGLWLSVAILVAAMVMALLQKDLIAPRWPAASPISEV